jgi:type III secretory pathway component EscU
MLVTILSFLGIQSLRTILIKAAIYGGIGLVSWILVWFAGYNSAKNHYLDKMRLNEVRLEREIKDFKNKFETELEQKEILQEALAKKLAEDDEDAVSDPESTNRCISPDGLRRLNQGFGYR